MRIKAYVVLALTCILLLVVTCARYLSPAEPVPEPSDSAPVQSQSYILPSEAGTCIPPASHIGHKPTGTGTIRIEDIGEFPFDASNIQSARPDIFQQGHFSLFNILLHLDRQGDIELDYHFDDAMDTHIIDAINNKKGWWYQAYYSAGWFENNVFRMDMYPYKDGTTLRMSGENERRLLNIYRTFREEVDRLESNGGNVIIPEVSIRSNEVKKNFHDVVVVPHNVRSDVLKPGVVTALDILLSLAEQGELSLLKLTWYGNIDSADPVDSYWVEQIDEAEAFGRCGFVYETGPTEFPGSAGSHIHIPSDMRVIVSPEYALWFWICL